MESCEKWSACTNESSIVMSFPKFGRTWFRCLIDQIKFSQIIRGFSHGKPHPQTVGRHKLKNAEEKERWNLVAEPFIVSLRDPRDVLVSSYFELLYRTKLQGKHFRKTLSEYIRSDRGSLPAIVQHQNFWSGEDTSYSWHTLYHEISMQYR
jgi:hypothetical protein